MTLRGRQRPFRPSRIGIRAEPAKENSGRLFEHLRHLPGPLRLADLAGYVRSLGIAPARMFSRTFQGTPMRHRGVAVGYFFLAEKADGEEFTDDEEEVLTLFAAHVAVVASELLPHLFSKHAGARQRATASS